MSQAEVERFVENLKNDEGLRNELSEHASGIGSIVGFAKDHGYEIDDEEVRVYINAQAEQELTDEQLEMVAGGKGGGNDGGPTGQPPPGVTTVFTAMTGASASANAEASVGVVILTVVVAA